SAGVPNAFLGRVTAANQVTWTGVPIDAPGTVGTRVVRITNLRGNASQLGVSSTLVPSQVVAFVSITSTQPLALANPQQIIGFVTRGLDASIQGPGDFGTGRTLLQCTGINRNIAGDPTRNLQQGIQFRARFREGFASSFKRRVWAPGDVVAGTDGGVPVATGGNVVLRNMPPGGTTGTGSLAGALVTGVPAQTQARPGQNLFTESGYYPGGGSLIGLADTGTRVLIRLTNIPTGAQIFASQFELGATAVNSRVVLVGFDPTGTGTVTAITPTVTSPIPGTSVPVAEVPVTVTGGAAALVYEVVSSDPTVIETIDIPVTVAFAPAAAGLGTANAILSFAPVSSVITASQTAPIPRFADVTTSSSAFTINPCRTNLLFPFVTNQAGFDTGLAISNTSLDIYSASADQSGPCRIHYFGQTTGGGAAPATQTTSAAIPAGGQLTFVLSTGGTSGIVGTPGFQGYIIAQCDFQFAHGFAFVTDGPIGAARVAEGYLALVIDTNISSRAENISESVGH
ncbi:MAG TPA: hypothetical protein VFL57_13250, partial [Bryobacteraceae bacterium]|nr:hypothetical protein [Bryobacteraceae bacterium]